MGVPAFFRWLSRKYPSIVANTNEQKPQQVDGVTVPVDATQPNPNGVEFDNFYLDMNGIIHPCCHPEDRPAPRNEDEMMANIFEYIDRLFRIVRPRRLLYMAIDGVAPRAKMNQQRSRRFRAAKDAQELRDQIASVRDELASQGIPLPPERRPDEHFDSNCITPGTPFMARLAVCLRYYIHERLNNDPAWKNLIVILSDASSPGEGEHKIMDFIRKQRASPGHDPNTQHVLCGADADLIMLGLATHEPNFTIIREEFVPNTQKPCDLCHQYGHSLRDCQGLSTIKSGEYGEVAQMCQRDKNFIYIRLSVLREYLARDLAMPNLPFGYDLERVIDDWVFMCFFVGNDFLPHLPSLEIREGAIDRLIKLYKECVYKTGGYLTDSGWVELSRVQLIMSELGAVEDEIFRNRQQNELEQRRRNKERRQRMKAATAPSYIPNNAFAPVALNQYSGANSMSGGDARQAAYEMRMANKANEDAAKALRAQIGGRPSADDTRPAGGGVGGGVKRKHEEIDDSDEEPEPNDEVRLWEEGWKERYYQSKFEVSLDDTQFRYKVAMAYVEGLCWVLRYYYQGVPDWSWFYPYHYAPFASDFVDIGQLKPNFDENSQPVTPLVQLMSVFPAASRKHLPVAWANLMVNKESPIIDFYPSDFQVDLNGKKFAWQGVALLPFVDSERLAETLEEVEPFLSDEERSRNQRGDNEMFISKHHAAHEYFVAIYETGDAEKREVAWVQIDASLTSGTSGVIAVDAEFVPAGGSLKSAMQGFPDILNNQASVVLYRDPPFAREYRFSSARLEGAVDPPASLKPKQWDDSRERYRPMIGFTRDVPRAEMDVAGKRMLWAGIGGQGPYHSQDYHGGGHYRSQSDSQRYGNQYGNGDRYSNQGYDNRRNNRYEPYPSRGGGPHWQQQQQQQSHQRGSYYGDNYQQQSYYGNNNRGPPMYGSASYGDRYGGAGGGGGGGGVRQDPHQYWQQPQQGRGGGQWNRQGPQPPRQHSYSQQPYEQQQRESSSNGRNRPSASDYF